MEEGSEEEDNVGLSQGSKKTRRKFLEAAAYHLAGTCPAESRFLLWTLDKKEDKSPHNVNQACCYCFQIFLSGNYRVRLKPRVKLTPQVAKLLKKERKNYKLNLKQTKILKRYKESKNVLLVTCNLCGKTARYYGKSREDFGVKTIDLMTFSKKTTPVSSSHSGSKKATPSSSPRTPMSSRLSTPRSSRTPKNAKAHFTQLKKLLQLEKKKSDKGGLKNFLVSLK